VDIGGNVAASINYIDFVVTGDPARARATAESALMTRKFRVQWHDDWTATAERGSKTGNLVAGAMAQYFKVAVRLMSAGSDQTTVRVEKQSSGWMGGAIGASRTKKNFAALKDELQATFAAAGVLVSVQTA
jgi:hypothetical protein